MVNQILIGTKPLIETNKFDEIDFFFFKIIHILIQNNRLLYINWNGYILGMI